MRVMRRWLPPVVLAVALGWAASAQAGPPYVTDDPAPTDQGHWEVYDFVGGSHVAGDTAGEAGLDLNYGAAPGLQLTLVLPGAWEHDDKTHAAAGTVEIAAKYRFLRQAEGTWTPDLAVFPRAFAPTAPARFGSGRWGLLLPVWAEKDFGPWQVFGGGGYQFNPGPDSRDFWTGGVAVQRTVTRRLSLGAEVYRHTADAVGARPYTGVNLGATWKLLDHWSLLASGGPGVENPAEGGRYAFYLALKADY
jgi:hypothetical protein